MLEERREVLGGEPSRGPRAWVTWLAVAAVAVAAVVVVSQGESGPAPRPPSPAPSTPTPRVATGPPWGLVPPARTEGGRTSVHLVFPDGSTAEMSYSTELGLARLGVRPHTWGWLPGAGGCCARPIFAPPDADSWFASGGSPTDRFGGADGGQVVVVPPPGAGPQSAFLVFGFGRWRVGVQSDREDRMDAARSGLWAENLHGRTTDDGFLVLRGGGALRLTTPPDEDAPTGRGELGRPHDGPQLRFGRGFMAAYGIGSFDDPSVVFEPVSHCRDFLAIAGYLEVAARGAVCKGPSMRVWVGGDDRFVQRALRDIRVWNVRPASR